MKFTPGKLVVLEGLDATGKSTLVKWLQTKPDWAHPEPLFTHQPSGIGALGEEIYRITEQDWDMPSLTRQLLHLASHEVHYTHQILPALSERGVVMDRCWMSTLAYGIAGGLEARLGFDNFEWLARLPTQGHHPDLVMLFMEPHSEDRHNTPELEQAYWNLKDTLDVEMDIVVMPKQSKAQTYMSAVQVLVEHRIVEP